MKGTRFLMTVVCSAQLLGPIQAQEDTREKLGSYSYVELQGGLQMTSTNAKMTKLFTPTVGVSFGHYFSSVMGARLHINGWQAKSGFEDLDKYYKWKYITPNLDLMLNLNNLFSKKITGSHPLNVILLFGAGLNIAWDNKELKDLDLHAGRVPLAWDKNRLSHNLRAGLRLETDVTKPFGLSLEVNANSLSDRFNSKTNNSNDWQFTAMLGVSYRFNKRYAKPIPIALPIVQEVVDNQSANAAIVPIVVAEKKKVKKEVTREEPVQIKREVFYGETITETNDKAAVQEIANFLKNHKNAKITIVGYADKGTGTPEMNKVYAKDRAENFKKMLVNDFGCDATAIKTDSKGDTVQPFANDNDKNRCVIIEGQGVKVYTETIEVEE